MHEFAVVYKHRSTACELAYLHVWHSASLRLQRAKQQREAVGVELYGYQQNLAKLQVALERTQENYQAIAQIRQQVGTHR